MSSKVMRIGPQLSWGYEQARGSCPECGGQCGDECGIHPLGCIFGGTGGGYWLIAEGCTLDHGEHL